MAKKTTKKEDKLNLESILFNCRDYLRSNATLNDKRDLLLTLVFLRFIGEKFEDAQIAMREECMKNGITDEAIIEAFLNSPARYQNVAYVPEAARWSNLINIPAAKLNAALDDALQAIDDSGRFFLLSIDIYGFDITLLSFNILCALHKHTARAAARIIERSIEWLDESRNKLDYIVRRIKLSILLGCVNRK